LVSHFFCIWCLGFEFGVLTLHLVSHFCTWSLIFWIWNLGFAFTVSFLAFDVLILRLEESWFCVLSLFLESWFCAWNFGFVSHILHLGSWLYCWSHGFVFWISSFAFGVSCFVFSVLESHVLHLESWHCIWCLTFWIWMSFVVLDLQLCPCWVCEFVFWLLGCLDAFSCLIMLWRCLHLLVVLNWVVVGQNFVSLSGRELWD